MQTAGSHPEIIAEMIRSTAGSIAAQASETLLAGRPELTRDFGDRAFAHWRGFFVQRLHELAAAVQFQCPQLFEHDTRWAGTAFASRGIPSEHLTAAFHAMEASVRAQIVPCGALDECLDAARACTTQSPPAPASLDRHAPRADLLIEYMQHAISGSRREALTLLRHALERGTPHHTLYCEILLPAEHEIGSMWHRGELSVPEEHAASEITRAAMALLTHLTPPEDSAGATVVCCAVEGNTHDIAVRAGADLLEVAGLRSICLGASVPNEDLSQATADFDARLVCISAVMSTHLPALADALATLRGSHPNVRTIIAGPVLSAVPEVGARLGADACLTSMNELVPSARSLLG